MGKKFVLHTDWHAKRVIEPHNDITKSLVSLRSASLQKEVRLLKGSMLEELVCSERSTTGQLMLRCLDNEGLRVVCPESVLLEISLFQAEVLVAVNPVHERLKVLDDRMWLREAAMIMVGSQVWVDVAQLIAQEPDTLQYASPVHGVVRYCGPVPEIGKGIMFGVELMEHPELGTCEGSIKYKHYFTTRSKNGLFLAINKLRLLQERRSSFNPCSVTAREGSPFEAKIGLSTPEDNPSPSPPRELASQRDPYKDFGRDSGYSLRKDSSRESIGSSNRESSSRASDVSYRESSLRPQPIPYEKACVEDKNLPPLKLNDKVVWISDTGPEYGVVRWLGKLPDVGNDWMVGVEFDNPVGSGTGKYNDYQLFEAKLNHASLVPIIGLMKAEDFLGNKSLAAPNSTPPRPTRRKKISDFQESNLQPALGYQVQQSSFSSLPRDFQNKADSSSCIAGGTCSNNVSPHSTIQRRSTPPPASHTTSHIRSHSASLSSSSAIELPGINALYSTVDKTFGANKQRDKQSSHRISEPNIVSSNVPLAHASSKTNSSSTSSILDRPNRLEENYNGAVTKLTVGGSPSQVRAECNSHSPSLTRRVLPPTALDITELSRGLSTKSDVAADGVLENVNPCPSIGQSFYHVRHDECKTVPTGVSKTNGTHSVNPLYEVSNRKNNSLKLSGTTRLDDSTTNGHFSNPSPASSATKKISVTSSNGVNTNNNYNQAFISGTSHLPPPYPHSDLEVGSVVEVMINGEPCYGVIQWIGTMPDDQNSNKLVAGIEMEEENPACTDGTFSGHRYFHCQPKKAFFVRLNQCRKDGRFLESEKRKSTVFGSIDCPSVLGDIPPLCNVEKMRQLCGKNRGIQGHHNSCYLDATLFAMFSCTNVLDSLLHRPAGEGDIDEYSQVQKVLKEEIVNPLRANMYVRADRVMKLRTLLDRLSSVSGLMTEEKDPEEFLNSLLNQILKADPFLKLSSGQEAYFYQLFVEKDEKLVLPTVQQLFDQSFLASDIKLTEIPPCLLIQMPRFGKQFKMYPRIIPSLYLDITDVLDDSPRQCSVCGQVAEFECKECFEQLGTGLDSTAFCQLCMEKSHTHRKRSKHKCTALSIPSEFRMLKEHVGTIPRVYMELFAVLCIETSHYVSFVKCGSGPDAPWVFFDSMADRKGEQNGYNIPEVVPFQDLKWWLSDEGTDFLSSTKEDRVLPEIARRLLCDAYMCLYQSPDVMMYR